MISDVKLAIDKVLIYCTQKIFNIIYHIFEQMCSSATAKIIDQKKINKIWKNDIVEIM